MVGVIGRTSHAVDLSSANSISTIDVAPRACSHAGADLLVVDQTDGVGRAAERGGGGLRQRRGFEVVAVGGVALEPVPHRAQRARLGTQGERVGVGAGRQRADDLLPEVVVREVARQPVPRHRVEPPLQALARGAVVGDPGLRPVEVAVDGRSEVLVEREDQLGVDAPDTGRGAGHARRVPNHAGRETLRRSRRPDPTLGPMAPPGGYDRLTALDESFLHLERAETPMHVGAVAVLERGPFFDADGRFRLDEVRALVASRLQLIPRFRKRVMAVPLGQGRPVWVDHEGFDIAEHVRLTALPAPGSRRQLLELAERLIDPGRSTAAARCGSCGSSRGSTAASTSG